MHRRNPHVFGASTPTGLSAAEVNEQWQQIKATERLGKLDDRRAPSPYDGIAPGLPALLLATKVLEREPSAASGLPGPDDESADLGDRLLALVGEAVASGVDPEQALRDAVRRQVR